MAHAGRRFAREAEPRRRGGGQSNRVVILRSPPMNQVASQIFGNLETPRRFVSGGASASTYYVKAFNRDVQPFAVVICMFVGNNCRDVFSNGNCLSSLSCLSRLLLRCVGVEELPLRIVPADSFSFELREACFLHHDCLDVLCQRVMQNIATEVEWGLFFKKKCYLERKWVINIIKKRVY